MTNMALQPIGTINTGFTALDQCPRNSRFNPEESTITIFPEFADALHAVTEASHLHILYWFDQADRSIVKCRTPHDGKIRGVFANRSPNRPNPIAISVVRLVAVEGNTLRVSGLDCLDGTMLLDIKPYVPVIDKIEDATLDFEKSLSPAP